MRVKCYSVRLASLDPVSKLAYEAVAYDGSRDIIPASQVFGQDYEVVKSDAWWISAWILERKHVQYSNKKSATFDSSTRRRLSDIIVEKHHPDYVQPVDDNRIADLRAE